MKFLMMVIAMYGAVFFMVALLIISAGIFLLGIAAKTISWTLPKH